MRWLTFCLTCHLVLCSVAGLRAQSETVPEKETVPATTGSSVPVSKGADALVRETGPPIYYLKNQEGQLVPVLGFGYDDFMKLLAQTQSAAPGLKPVSFTIDRADIQGTVEGRRANLDAKLTVTSRRDGSIRVPIGLSQAILREDLKYQGAGSAFLDYDAKRKAYVVWIDGKKDQKHELSLAVTMPVTTIGLDTRLRFDAPRSTRSQMTLMVPETDLEVHAPIESRLTTIENRKGEKPQTRLTIDSVRGDFQLLWHKSPNSSSNVRTVMEATGEIIVNIGSLDITCVAALKVRGRGMPIDRFRIRLPEGTETYEVSDGDYQVIEVENPDSPNGSGGEKPATPVPATGSNGGGETVAAKRNRGARIIEVRLTDPTSDWVEFRISTKRPLDRTSVDWLEPAGFEVIDAIRQSGYVAAIVGPDYFVSWSPERGIRRVNKLPGTMEVKDPSVIFRYYSAPFLLKSRVEPRRTRISVEPRHIVHVGADQLQLKSRFDYTIRGKEVLSLVMDLGDWELDKIGPETLVDAKRVIFEKGVVTVPLLRPTIGHVELEIEAHRVAPRKETKLEITFPRPRVNSWGPAVVVIQPDDNVKLLPDVATSTGLNRLQEAPPMIQLPERQQEPLCYRGTAGQVIFSAKRSIHEQQVSVDIQSTVVFEESTARVKQVLTYQIDHEQSDRIVLAVPESVFHAADLEFLVDGVRVARQILEQAPPEQPTTPGSDPAEKSAHAMNTGSDASKTSTGPPDEKAVEAKPHGNVAGSSKSTPENTTPNASSPDVPVKPQSKPAGDSGNTVPTMPVALMLKSPRIGQCVVTVQYSLPSRELSPDKPIQRRIPFVLPWKEAILRHELSIRAPLGLTVEVLKDQIQRSEAGGAISDGELPRIEPIADGMISKADFASGTRQNFNITGRLGAMMVSLTMEKRHQAPSITIYRAFFQTWVADRAYYHRAVFRFRAEQDQIELTMPSDLLDDQVDFSLDGKSLSFELLGEKQYLILLPGNRHGLQELELQWVTRPSGKNRSALALNMPRLGKDAWIQRWYWQLLLPPDRHLVSTPKEVLSESSWKWEDGLFQREPLLGTEELEHWVGAKTSTPGNMPPANLYLFSSFGAPKEVEFRVANRSFIVLVASGLVLVIGFLLIYVPATRHPAGILVLGVVLGSMGVIYSEPMLLGLQASSLGVVLVGVTMILKRRMSRPKLPTPIPIAESGGSSILDRDSTQRQVILPPIVNPQKTTETQFKPPEAES